MTAARSFQQELVCLFGQGFAIGIRGWTAGWLEALFGKLGEVASKYLKKGSQAYFEGKIKTSKWQDQDGKDRYTTEIVANQMEMLGRRSSDIEAG